MADFGAQRRRIDELIATSEQLEAQMRGWQTQGKVSDDEVQKAQRAYLEWYNAAQPFVSAESLPKFRDMYEGGTFIKRIRAYFGAPVDVNSFYVEGSDNPFEGQKWQVKFDGEPRASIRVQRELLVEALHRVGDAAVVLDDIACYFRRIPEYLDALRRANSANVPVPTIENEAELQHLVLALLRLLYDDVRPEDYVSQFGGAGSRVDFLIRGSGVLVETKMTRPGLADRKVGEEILIDFGRYGRHPDCRGVFVLIYDPSRHISNAAALENDLTQQGAGLLTRAIVVR